jgi:putative flippase GtrA
MFQRLRWTEFLRFLIIAAMNTGATFLIYLVLLLIVPYGLAYTGSYVLGIFLSYCLNASFVFRERLRISCALQYPVVYLVQYVLGITALYVLVERVGCSKAVAPLLVVLVSLPVTFLLSRYLIKRPVRVGR